MKTAKNLRNRNDDLVSERDEVRVWLLRLGAEIGVDPEEGGSSVRASWALFRKDIMKKIEAL